MNYFRVHTDADGVHLVIKEMVVLVLLQRPDSVVLVSVIQWPLVLIIKLFLLVFVDQVTLVLVWDRKDALEQMTPVTVLSGSAR